MSRKRKPTKLQAAEQRIVELAAKLEARETELRVIAHALWPHFERLVHELVREELDDLSVHIP